MERTSGSRTRRSEAKWRETLNRFESSGLSVGVCCRREGLAVSSLHRWRRRLSRPTSGDAAPRFVELPSPSAPVAATGSWSIELELPDGVRLRLGQGR